jgi:hypothetical protein
MIKQMETSSPLVLLLQYDVLAARVTCLLVVDVALHFFSSVFPHFSGASRSHTSKARCNKSLF